MLPAIDSSRFDSQHFCQCGLAETKLKSLVFDLFALGGWIRHDPLVRFPMRWVGQALDSDVALVRIQETQQFGDV